MDWIFEQKHAIGKNILLLLTKSSAAVLWLMNIAPW